MGADGASHCRSPHLHLDRHHRYSCLPPLQGPTCHPLGLDHRLPIGYGASYHRNDCHSDQVEPLHRSVTLPIHLFAFRPVDVYGSTRFKKQG